MFRAGDGFQVCEHDTGNPGDYLGVCELSPWIDVHGYRCARVLDAAVGKVNAMVGLAAA